jgi:hypothetical protein
LGELSGSALTGWFRARHAGSAPATWNPELATLRAAVGWWRRCGLMAGDPTDRQRRPGTYRALGVGLTVGLSRVTCSGSSICWWV